MYKMAKMKLKYELIVFALWPPQGCTTKQVRHSWPEITTGGYQLDLLIEGFCFRLFVRSHKMGHLMHHLTLLLHKVI